MNAKPLQIAILIFAVGLTLVNLAMLFEQNTRFDATHPQYESTPVPTDADGGATNWDRFLSGEAPSLSSTAVPSKPAALPKATLRPVLSPTYVAAHTEANESALVRELLILTVAGIAWFLVAAKARTS